jgi:hypothetical protein
MVGPPFLLQHINRSQIHECGSWEQGQAVSFPAIFVSNFKYSVFAVAAVLISNRVLFHEIDVILCSAKLSSFKSVVGKSRPSIKTP